MRDFNIAKIYGDQLASYGRSPSVVKESKDASEPIVEWCVSLQHKDSSFDVEVLASENVQDEDLLALAQAELVRNLQIQTKTRKTPQK